MLKTCLGISFRCENLAICDCFCTGRKVPNNGYGNLFVRKISFCISQKQHKIKENASLIKTDDNYIGHGGNSAQHLLLDQDGGDIYSPVSGQTAGHSSIMCCVTEFQSGEVAFLTGSASKREMDTPRPVLTL